MILIYGFSEYAFKAVNAPNISALAVKGGDTAVIAVQKRVPVSFIKKNLESELNLTFFRIDLLLQIQ